MINLANKRAKNREYMREWQREHLDRVRERNRVNYAAHREKRVEFARQRRQENPDYSLEYRRKYREVCNARTRKWQKANPEKVLATEARYRANKLKATPLWLTNEQNNTIETIYAEAIRLTKLTGIKFEVDHIVPLQSKTVCGLHVPWNLAILSRQENAAKGNKI